VTHQIQLISASLWTDLATRGFVSDTYKRHHLSVLNKVSTLFATIRLALRVQGEFTKALAMPFAYNIVFCSKCGRDVAVETLAFAHVDNMITGFKRSITIIVAASSRHMF